jgi:hypothetical protein
MQTLDFKSFAEFYPFYLSQHLNRNCKIMHFIGTTIVFVLVGIIIATGNYILILLIPVFGYFFAWLGHFAFEKNRPATFKYPIYSLMGDFRMYFDILSGKLKI